jgi:hypothetical protein
VLVEVAQRLSELLVRCRHVTRPQLRVGEEHPDVGGHVRITHPLGGGQRGEQVLRRGVQPTHRLQQPTQLQRGGQPAAFVVQAPNQVTGPVEVLPRGGELGRAALDRAQRAEHLDLAVHVARGHEPDHRLLVARLRLLRTAAPLVHPPRAVPGVARAPVVADRLEAHPGAVEVRLGVVEPVLPGAQDAALLHQDRLVVPRRPRERDVDQPVPVVEPRPQVAERAGHDGQPARLLV